MSRLLIYAIVFIEGYSSLGAEVIALRRLVPHVGSSIVVTAPTIGFFLLALALGYAAGAKVEANYRAVVARNFLISALLAGFGLAAEEGDDGRTRRGCGRGGPRTGPAAAAGPGPALPAASGPGLKNGFAKWYEFAKRAIMIPRGVPHEDTISPQRIVRQD